MFIKGCLLRHEKQAFEMQKSHVLNDERQPFTNYRKKAAPSNK